MNPTHESEAILEFWLCDVGPRGWYVADASVDRKIEEKFGTLVDQALAGAFETWRDTARGTLALLILLDQFTRNLNRGTAKAFSGDLRARDIARIAVAQDFDLEVPSPERQFFYLPFEHSENNADQEWSVALFKTRMPDLPDISMYHVEQHREMIRRFGRFPFRNAALNRPSTDAEKAFLAEGGYTPGLQPKD